MKVPSFKVKDTRLSPRLPAATCVLKQNLYSVALSANSFFKILIKLCEP